MTLYQRLLSKWEQINNLVLRPESIPLKDREIKETDTPLIKKLKKMSVSTQTEKVKILGEEEFKVMEQNQKVIHDFVDRNIFLKDVGKKRDLMFKLNVIERGIDHLRSDLEHNQTKGVELQKGLEELKKNVEIGKVVEMQLEEKTKELQKTLEREESKYQLSLKVKEEEWEEMRKKLLEDYDSKDSETKRQINENLIAIKDLVMKFENREEQIRTLSKDREKIDAQLGVLKEEKKRWQIIINETEIDARDKKLEFSVLTDDESKLLRYLDYYRKSFILDFNRKNLPNLGHFSGELFKSVQSDFTSWVESFDTATFKNFTELMETTISEIINQHISPIFHVFLISVFERECFSFSEKIVRQISDKRGIFLGQEYDYESRREERFFSVISLGSDCVVHFWSDGKKETMEENYYLGYNRRTKKSSGKIKVIDNWHHIRDSVAYCDAPHTTPRSILKNKTLGSKNDWFLTLYNHDYDQ